MTPTKPDASFKPGYVMQTEQYSDDLIRSSNIYHRLHVNITFLVGEFMDAENDMNAMLENLSQTSGQDHEPYEIASNEIVREQIDSLKTIQAIEGENLRRLLQKESAFDLVFEDKHPLVIGYPKWIDDLFPYYQPTEVMQQISTEGGSIIKIFGDAFLAIPASVHESFIQVWWPVAGQVAEPGYLEKQGDREWESISLEK